MATHDKNQLAAIDQRAALIHTDAEGAAARIAGWVACSQDDVAMLALPERLVVRLHTADHPF